MHRVYLQNHKISSHTDLVTHQMARLDQAKTLCHMSCQRATWLRPVPMATSTDRWRVAMQTMDIHLSQDYVRRHDCVEDRYLWILTSIETLFRLVRG